MLVQLFVQNAMIVLSGTQFPECGASYNSECVCDFRLITFAGRKASKSEERRPDFDVPANQNQRREIITQQVRTHTPF